MASIIVQHHGWLGLKVEGYTVLVDSKEIGRLGRRLKRVECQVDEGTHTVEVVACGRSTGVTNVEAQKGSHLLLDLVFPAMTTIFWRTIRHRSVTSRERALSDVMTLALR
jgi:hypothetical protein